MGFPEIRNYIHQQVSIVEFYNHIVKSFSFSPGNSGMFHLTIPLEQNVKSEEIQLQDCHCTLLQPLQNGRVKYGHRYQHQIDKFVNKKV